MTRQRRPFIRRIFGEYDVTIETTIAMKHTYNEAIAKMIVWEKRMKVIEVSNEQALVIKTKRELMNCFTVIELGTF